jgi:hypothetical protein
MSTPVATIADALIEFIMSLLRDPSAVEEFDAEPAAVMKAKGLADVCVDDVRAVAPVVIDRPDVYPAPTPAPTPYYPSKPHHPDRPDDVVKEIKGITNNFVTIDNRPTIVDQSVNQNIWTEGGDVTQLFDNEAIVASGDGSVAAGEEAGVDNSETEIEVGEVSIGNETTDVVVEDSLNDSSTNTETEVEVVAEESFNDESTNTEVEVEVEDSFNDQAATTVVEVEAEDSFNYAETEVDTDVDVEYETEEQL